jgi:integrase
MAGKVITREWTSRGPLGRRVKHVAYGYDVTINGKRERRFSTEWACENEALEELLKRQRDAEAGIVPAAPRTLRELADEYLRYKEDGGKRSLKEDRRILNKLVIPAFGPDLQVKKLTAPAIAQYERQGANKVSAFTVANDLTVLRHMLNLGRRWGYLDHVPDIQVPKKPEGRRRFLDEAELGKLLDACQKSRNPNLGAIVTIAVNTGMRKAEILGLEWERVDLSSARLTLYKTKSGKPRGIPMNRAVYDVLVALAPADDRVGLVFRRRGGAARGNIRTAFTTALRNAAILGFRFHDLRHTFSSHFVMRGGSLKSLQEILGHSDYKTTQRYSHLSPAHLLADVQRLDGLTAHKTAQSAVESNRCAVSVDAPVAQVDRAAVS